MFERFTQEAKGAVSAAVEQAGALGHDSVGTQHLLLGLLNPDAGAGYQVLHGAGLEADRVREIVRRRTPADGILTQEDADSLRAIGIDLEVVLEHLAKSFGADAVPHSQPRRRGVGSPDPRRRPFSWPCVKRSGSRPAPSEANTYCLGC